MNLGNCRAVAMATPRPPPTTTSRRDERAETIAKHRVERAVDDEISGRVDRQQEVGDLAHAACQVVGVVVAEPEDGRHDGVRCDADDEQTDHGEKTDHKPIIDRSQTAFSVLADKLARKSVSEVTYFVSSGTSNLNSINKSINQSSI